MDYSFNAEIAAKYGVEEAVFVHNLYWWIRKNSANGRHYHDGRTWTYNSAKAFCELFPFWTAKQIRRIIKKLEADGALLIGNYNDRALDRTQWYALSEEVLDVYERLEICRAEHVEKPIEKGKCNLPNGQMDLTKRENASSQTGTAIPDINQIVNTDIKQVLSPLPPYGEKLVGKVQEFLAYKKEKRQSYTDTGLKALVKKICESADEFGADAVCDVIELTMQNNWQGIVWERLGLSETLKPNPQRDLANGRKYTKDELDSRFQNLEQLENLEV